MPQTIWITKYALTSGLQERPLIKIVGQMVKVEEPGGLNGSALYHGQEWWETKEDALSRVLVMIGDKRKSLTGQLRRLDDLENSTQAELVKVP